MGARNIIRLLTEGLVASEELDLASGEVLTFVPSVDDQGTLAFGNTTKAMDVKWYGTTATSIVTFDAGNNKLDLAGVAITSNAAINTSGTFTATGSIVPSSNGSVDQKTVIANSNTTLNATHWGALVYNQAASDRNYTLPTPVAGLAGKWFEYASDVGQNTTFTAQTANTILALNTLAANSVALSTANQIIGATCKWICNGEKWIFLPHAGAATITD